MADSTKYREYAANDREQAADVRYFAEITEKTNPEKAERDRVAGVEFDAFADGWDAFADAVDKE